MITKLASEVTKEDKINCVATRGHSDGTVTLYYEGDQVPEVIWSDTAMPTEDQF